MKVGIRGVSILVASGDSGANARTDYQCTENHLNPDYPASSPYVTAVGATQITAPVAQTSQQPICTLNGLPCAQGTSEEAVSFDVASFTSGGGFSNYVSRPSYQNTAVSSYLKSGVKLPPAGYFNASGRAYPDVAANGHNYLCTISGQVQPVGGTSASTPCFGGVVSLLNDARLNAGRNPLGFLNTLLYQMAAADPSTFHDITVGDNICTEAGCAPSCKGYLATKGWDPVTGLGTPSFSNMLKYVKNLPR